ncbi:signal peptidase I [Microbacterium sp.]|uniref:signal peptidase I n=1 Tax=Microbacterium sp. TaxID=51671 RepID=UPI0028110C87|nr:signal peptidase I [Microbacterium sp.]
MSADEPISLRRRITGSVWFHLALSFLIVGLILSFVAKPYLVPSGSMEQTLQPGDRVLVNRLAYVGADPGRGDVVVFDADETWGPTSADDDGPVKGALRWLGEVTGFGPSGPHTLIKRIVAGPGQTVSCCTTEGRLIVDGQPVDEPYVHQDLPFDANQNCTTQPASLRCLPEIVVPDDSYLVLGDHRSNSSDSAAQCRGAGGADPGCWRWVKRDQIVGRAVVILWPVSRWTGL